MAPPKNQSNGDLPTVSRVERKREKRVDEILRTASQVLAERGYHNTSLETIAERLDLTKASLYYYYDSKDALIQACLTRVTNRAIEVLTDIEAMPGSAGERLHALVVGHVKLLTQQEPEMSRLFLQPLDWPDSISSTIREYRWLHSQTFDRVIDDGLQTGEFESADSHVARHCMYGAINYVSVWFRPSTASQDEKVINAVADEVLKFFTAP